MVLKIVGTYGPSVCMLLIAFIPKSNPNLVMPYLILNGALASSQHYGVVINNIDISPNFAGIIAGFSYAISSATSLFAPLQVQYLVTDQVFYFTNVFTHKWICNVFKRYIRFLDRNNDFTA